jgi:hypothetical protein
MKKVHAVYWGAPTGKFERGKGYNLTITPLLGGGVSVIGPAGLQDYFTITEFLTDWNMITFKE